MDGTAVIAIRDLAQDAGGTIVTIEGIAYSPVALHDPRKPEPVPTALEFSTLTGLADYCEANPDSLIRGTLVLHVEDPWCVRLLGPLTGRFHQRSCFARACHNDEHFPFGRWLDLETMVIALQARFVDHFDRPRVLRLLGNVKDEQVATQADDGVTQQVTVRSGVAVVERTDVPNPVALAPWRTFPEIEQPASLFILRLRKNGPEGVVASLHEADGGAWRNEATKNIGDWLQNRLNETGLWVLA